MQLADFVDRNPLASAADFTAVIDWGDAGRRGSPERTDTSAGQVVEAGENFYVLGSHAYAEPAASSAARR